MSIELNSDNNINKIIKPEFSVVEAPVINKPAEIETSQVKNIEQDGTNLHNTKGKVPASGFSFNSAETPQIIKTAEKFLTYFLNDNAQLSSFSSALEKLSQADSLDDLSQEDMLALMQLGFDITVNNGQLLVRDSSGNNVNPDELMKGLETLQNTVKRAVSSLSSGNVSQAAIQANSEKFVPPAEDIKKINEQVKITNTVVQDTNIVKAEVEKQRAEYLELVNQIEKNNAEIDTTVSQILILREKAQKIIDSSKQGNPISDTEKKELKDIETNIKIKQAKLGNIQDSSDLLMKQAGEVFNNFAPELNDSERNTMSQLHGALEAKVSGKALTARQNFLATISSDIYNLTSGMNEGELNKVLNDTNLRVKMFAPVNKMLERVKAANSMSELQQSDIDMLWSKFRIQVVDDGKGGFDMLYHSADGTKSKVTKDDLKTLSNDLNNIVSSPTLFNFARASGQLIVAYDKEPVKQTEGVNVPSKKDFDSSKVQSSVSVDKEQKNEISDIDEEASLKRATMAESAYLSKSIDKRREESEYHEKQIAQIYENRREVNRYLENKRAQEKSQLN